MLKSLSINNVAVIEHAIIDFESGLNILTGETGAGKSIIIDSLNLILGNRASKEIVRSGEINAKVEALFDVSKNLQVKLEEYGINAEDELLITREVNIDGKNNIRINGNLSTLSILKEIGKELINIHGQNDNQDLLNPDKHIKILDKYAGNTELLDEYKKEFKEAQNINNRINELTLDSYEKERKLSLLTYEIETIENVGLKEGEYEELLEKRKKIANSKKISDSLSKAYDLIKKGYNGSSCDELLSDSLKTVGEIASFDKELEVIHEKLNDIYYNLYDISDSLRDYMSSFMFNENEIDDIEKRIDEINDLRRRFGADYQSIISYYEKITEEVKNINLTDENLKKLNEELALKKKNLALLSEKLTLSRTEAGKKLQKEVMMHLDELNMKNSVFEVEIKKEDKFGKDGVDKVEFLISANVGMEAGKLAKIASGGELSRVMLGINCALLNSFSVPTMIYDEIDTGVSGRAAQKISEKLYYVSKDRQVLCVTHLAQIASMADAHYLIEKNVVDNSTKTKVVKMNEDEKVNEIARIIGGAKITDNTLLSAKDMILQSYKYKHGEKI